MAKVRIDWNLEGFAELRGHPVLVAAMTEAMRSATAGTPFDVEVWPHRGRRSGPRTSVQAWARTRAADRELARNPDALVQVLARTGIPFTAKPRKGR